MEAHPASTEAKQVKAMNKLAPIFAPRPSAEGFPRNGREFLRDADYEARERGLGVKRCSGFGLGDVFEFGVEGCSGRLPVPALAASRLTGC